jgi:hypothetical protein
MALSIPIRQKNLDGLEIFPDYVLIVSQEVERIPFIDMECHAEQENHTMP